MSIFHVPPEDFDPKLLREPAEILRSGGIVAFPTETVYGLGASARQPEAVERLVRIKGRAADKPFSYHLASAAAISELPARVPPVARALIERYFPGPLTLVLPSDNEQSTATVGVRVPANEVARKLIELAGTPLFVPSANPAGQPPALCAAEVTGYFGRQIDAVVDGGEVLLKQASTVVLVDESGYKVLREGIITKDMIHQLLEGRRVLFVCTGNTCRSPMAAELFRKHLAARLDKEPDELNELGYRILSAGTFAAWGNRPTDNAVKALRERGCDLSHHISQPVTRDLLTSVNRVYTLGASHFKLLKGMTEEIEDLKRPQLSMLGTKGITDPVGGDLETYRRCAADIEETILKLLPR